MLSYGRNDTLLRNTTRITIQRSRYDVSRYRGHVSIHIAIQTTLTLTRAVKHWFVYREQLKRISSTNTLFIIHYFRIDDVFETDAFPFPRYILYVDNIHVLHVIARYIIDI